MNFTTTSVVSVAHAGSVVAAAAAAVVLAVFAVVNVKYKGSDFRVIGLP